MKEGRPLTITSIETRDARYKLGAGDGADAIHRDPTYAYATTLLGTDGPHAGTGLAFTLGGGNDLVCRLIRELGCAVGRQGDRRNHGRLRAVPEVDRRPPPLSLAWPSQGRGSPGAWQASQTPALICGPSCAASRCGSCCWTSPHDRSLPCLTSAISKTCCRPTRRSPCSSASRRPAPGARA